MRTLKKRLMLMLGILMLGLGGAAIALAQTPELPERVDITSGWSYDLGQAESGVTRIELTRAGNAYALRVLEHKDRQALSELPAQVPLSAVRRLVEVMRAPVPAQPDPDAYGTPAQMQTAIDAAFDPATWQQPDAHAAAVAYRDTLREPAAVGRALRSVRGNFANHLHRSLKVELRFADGSTLTAGSREMGLRMTPWQHPGGAYSHSLAFADAVAAVLPQGAVLRDELSEPITDAVRKRLLTQALRDANAYYDAFNRAPMAAKRLREHFAVRRMWIQDRPDSGDFAAFQAYLKTGRWPPVPPRLRAWLAGRESRRDVTIDADLLLADGDLADPALIERMQARLQRTLQDASLLLQLAPGTAIQVRMDGEFEPAIHAQFARQMANAGWHEFQRDPALLRDAVPVMVNGVEEWLLLRDGRSVVWKRSPMGRLPDAAQGERWCSASPSRYRTDQPEPPEGRRLSRGDDSVCMTRMHSAQGEVVAPARGAAISR